MTTAAKTKRRRTIRPETSEEPAQQEENHDDCRYGIEMCPRCIETWLADNNEEPEASSPIRKR